MTIQENVPLAPFTTLGVGGPARWFARIDRQHELLSAISFAHARRLPIFILGGGSNLLVADAGFNGLVIHAAFGDISRVDPDLRHLDRRRLTASASTPASPGTTSSSPSAPRASAASSVSPASPAWSAPAPSRTSAPTDRRPQAASSTSPRSTSRPSPKSSSTAKPAASPTAAASSTPPHRNRYIITAVEFQFDPAAKPNLAYADLARHFAAAKTPPTPLDIYTVVRAIRARKGMLLVEGDPDTHSAGSFFKNPIVEESAVEEIAAKLEISATEIPQWPADQETVKLSAAWLIERAGFSKGFSMGRAGISTKHTLALVNLGNATAAEIIALRNAILHKVEERFAIPLDQEPVMLGFTPLD